VRFVSFSAAGLMNNVSPVSRCFRVPIRQHETGQQIELFSTVDVSLAPAATDER